MISTTQRERSDRCGVPDPTHKNSLGEADNHLLNRFVARKNLFKKMPPAGWGCVNSKSVKFLELNASGSP